MEERVPRAEGPDREPKNFHLSKQAGESHGNSESNSMRVTPCKRRLRSPLWLLKEERNQAHKGTQGLFNTNHDLEGGQNTLIVCPNTQKH